MGREVRRVPLDFNHPLNQVWSGFLHPDEFAFPPCPDCTYEAPPTIMDRLFPTPRTGSGYTPEAYAISQTFYPHMIGGPMADRLAWHDKLGQAEVDNLVAAGRLSVWTPREPTEDNPRTAGWSQVPRLAAEVNAERHAHDAINRGILVEFRCEQLGIPMYCTTCNGNGDVATEEQREASENWEGTGPPEGDGWQLWETVSEGSPISPVFETDEALARWMTQNDCTVNGPVRTFEAALKFVRDGWAPSFVASTETGVVDGVTWVGAS